MARQALFKVFGVLFIVGGLYFAVYGVYAYIQQLAQQDWPVRMAVATEVTTRIESTGIRKAGHKRVYDVVYEYNDGGERYTGEIIGTVTKYAVGDRFDIKCDPKAPEASTHILTPRADGLVMNVVGAIAFIAVGLWAAGVFSYRKPAPKSGRTRL